MAIAIGIGDMGTGDMGTGDPIIFTTAGTAGNAPSLGAILPCRGDRAWFGADWVSRVRH
jgi:hypothetical protein